MTETIIINPAYGALRDFIGALPGRFDGGELVFRSRNTIRRFTAPDGTVLVVKHFRRRGLLQRIIYSTVEHSKGRRAYDNGLELLRRGFDTPEPVAYIELKRRGLLCDTYFVSRECNDAGLYGALVDTELFDHAQADAVASLLARMHDSGALHGDPNLNNILCRREADGSLHLTLIDTNRSHFTAPGGLSASRCLDNLKRVTHRRDLLAYIVGRYAGLRGLDPEVSVRRVTDLVSRFERNRERRHRVKALFKH